MFGIFKKYCRICGVEAEKDKSIVTFPRQWNVVVNGQQKDLSYVPMDLDKILVTTSTDPAQQRQEMKSVTDFAKNH